MKAKQFFITTLAVLLAGLFTAGSCSKLVSKQTYESVEGDPLKTRIYTLENGLWGPQNGLSKGGLCKGLIDREIRRGECKTNCPKT